jgi:ribosomal protein S18 acetylase RimI-like enzyme
MIIRDLRPEEWNLVAALIFRSTNDWYERNLNRSCFPGDDPAPCRIFPEVYEALDPGCCLVAEIEGELAGSCFYHPRETHLSLGIMNASAQFSGQGVARSLLDEVILRAGDKPVRLVSSAMNLDSYSLYTRAGFRPLAIYQDMFLPHGKSLPPASAKIRRADLADLPAIMQLEEETSGIRREKDWRYFLNDQTGIWSGSVYEEEGKMAGFLFSVEAPGSKMLGPGAMRNESAAFELIVAQLADFGENQPIFLAPAKATGLISKLYGLGARNCELHLSQVLGEAPAPTGITMPTFMPETG